jgi:tetraacyldisaccharide 4'-kinase
VVNSPRELQEGEFAMQCQGDRLINLLSGETKSLADFAGKTCHAVAGIGNPGRFFNQLAAAGLNCQAQAFPDHHLFTAADLKFNDDKPVIMTEKDAVKCSGFAQSNHWYCPIDAMLPTDFSEQLLTLLKDKTHGP